MRILIPLLILAFALSCSSTFSESNNEQVVIDLNRKISIDTFYIDENEVSSDYREYIPDNSTFKLTYIYAGLGSGYNSMQPVFKVNGTDYLYTLEENSSWTGEYTQKPDTLHIGKLRKSSIDSIIELTSIIKETLVYRTAPNIMSGGIHSIKIESDIIDLTFRLHNASDPIAEKIVTILNSNIPGEIRKLWLFNLPGNE